MTLVCLDCVNFNCVNACGPEAYICIKSHYASKERKCVKMYDCYLLFLSACFFFRNIHSDENSKRRSVQEDEYFVEAKGKKYNKKTSRHILIRRS